MGVVSGSRDKTAMVWELTPDNQNSPGYARRCLHGHNEAINDCVISSDGQFALTGSSDNTMRLWDLNTGGCVRKFKGHTKDVSSVAFSADNRQIVSGSFDKTIRLWNTLAECKYTIGDPSTSGSDCHTDWISCVRFSPSAKNPLIVSCSWDKLIKVWNLSNCKLKTTLAGHTNVLYTITISPDGSLCASGGKDSISMLWDVNDGKHLYSLDASAGSADATAAAAAPAGGAASMGGSAGAINAMCFSPKNYWLCAATDFSIKIWDLENKQCLDELSAKNPSKSGIPWVVSLQWSADGNTLFAGSTDGHIYVYQIGRG